MAKLDIVQIPVLNENYVYLVREPDTESVAVVDRVQVIAEVRQSKDNFRG